MRQYVLTRSAFGSAWDRPANARRLAITKAVTARLLSAQTTTAWTWVVLLDDRDPFLAQRLALYRDSAPAFCPIVVHRPPEQMRFGASRVRQRMAAADYKAAWRTDIPSDDTVLMTRLDDDDGLAPDALERCRNAAESITRRTVLMLPVGIRVWRGRYTESRHQRNAMHTLVTPPGDSMCVYDYGHTKVDRPAPNGPGCDVLQVDERPGWLWVRHLDTISDSKGARLPSFERLPLRPLTREVKRMFPIDWSVLVR